MEAAGRGVRVAVVVQGWSDHRVFQQASRVLYGALLDHGIEIYEYERSELHAKAACVDGRWATVGSSNLDPFSLLLAREANVFVRDDAFAAEMLGHLRHAIAHQGKRVGRETHAKRPVWTRALSWVAYGLMRFALLVTGLKY